MQEPLVPRRSPDFRRFIVTGALIGLAVGVWISLSGIFEDPEKIPEGYVYSETTGAGFLGLLGAFVFGLIAALIALYLDWRARR